jgi:uncharacterized protein (DUF1800 family)
MSIDRVQSVAPAAPEADVGSAERPSRRGMFRQLGAAAAASLLAPTVARAQQPVPRVRRATRAQDVGLPQQIPGLIDPISGWNSATLRLVNRVTMGATPEELTRAKRLGYAGYLEYQLAYEAIDDSAVETVVATRYPLLAQTPLQLYQVSAELVRAQLADAALYRAAFSKRQLFERMVELWTDHFNIYVPKVGYLKIADDRDVVRKHALGKFPALLSASAHSPAMLAYLDNTLSRRTNPNQNYAREIMELHSMGADGGYTQQDVAELARCFSGWSLQGRGEFGFVPGSHDYGAKTVLGQTIPAMATSAGAAGIQDGETMLKVIAEHPSTARFIARKIAQWLLRYDPDPALVSRVAGVYTSTGGDIRAMIRVILEPAQLTDAPAKYKRPFHLAASALRVTAPAVTDIVTVTRQLATMGQPVFNWDPADGFPDSLEFWAGNLLPRWNFASFLANANNAAVRVNIAPLMVVPTADAIVSQIGATVFGGKMTKRMREELVAYLKPAPTSTARVRETLALALSSSSFQWY